MDDRHSGKDSPYLSFSSRSLTSNPFSDPLFPISPSDSTSLSSQLPSLQSASVPVDLTSPVVTIEAPDWNYRDRTCFCCVKTARPSSDECSIVARGSVRFSPYLNVVNWNTLLPCVESDVYRLEWEPNHPITAVITREELLETCESVTRHISPIAHKVTTIQIKKHAFLCHWGSIISYFLLIIGIITQFFTVIGTFLTVIGMSMYMVISQCGKMRCRQEGYALAAAVAQRLQEEVMRRRGLAGVKMTVGAFGTYVRFAVQREV